MSFDASSFIKSVKVKINGQTVHCFDGSGNALTEHVNITKEECYICKFMGKDLSASEFQNMYGTKHVRTESGWICYRGSLIINEYLNEWIEIWNEIDDVNNKI